jgi:hypothetical protein
MKSRALLIFRILCTIWWYRCAAAEAAVRQERERHSEQLAALQTDAAAAREATAVAHSDLAVALAAAQRARSEAAAAAEQQRSLQEALDAAQKTATASQRSADMARHRDADVARGLQAAAEALSACLNRLEARHSTQHAVHRRGTASSSGATAATIDEVRA